MKGKTILQSNGRKEGFKMKFSVNDTVIYGTHGVCTVEEISKREFCGTTGDYYTLKPVFSDRSTIYVPVEKNTDPKPRKVMSESEVYEVIRDLPASQCAWVENDMARKNAFSGILKSGSASEIAGLVKTLYEKHASLEKQNKRLHSADKRVLSEAEKMFHEEVAYVLNIERDSVAPFISETLRKMKEA